MKTFRIAFLALATTFAVFPVANANEIQCTFTGTSGISGALDLFGSGGLANFTISSGTVSYLTGSSSQIMNLYQDFPGAAKTSPSGAFIYDNLIYPNSNPILDNWGLLFKDAIGDEANLWGNGGSSYSFYEYIPGQSYTIADNTVSMSHPEFTATPEPGSLLLLGSGLFGLALLVFHKAKHSQVRMIV